VVANQTHVILVWDSRRPDCNQAVIRCIALLDTIPEFVWVEAILTQIVLLWKPSRQHV